MLVYIKHISRRCYMLRWLIIGLGWRPYTDSHTYICTCTHTHTCNNNKSRNSSLVDSIQYFHTVKCSVTTYGEWKSNEKCIYTNIISWLGLWNATKCYSSHGYRTYYRTIMMNERISVCNDEWFKQVCFETESNFLAYIYQALITR